MHIALSIKGGQDMIPFHPLCLYMGWIRLLEIPPSKSIKEVTILADKVTPTQEFIVQLLMQQSNYLDSST